MLATFANNAGQAILLVRGGLDSVDVLRDVTMHFDDAGSPPRLLGVTEVNPTDPTQTAIPLFFTRGVYSILRPSVLSARWHRCILVVWIFLLIQFSMTKCVGAPYILSDTGNA